MSVLVGNINPGLVSSDFMRSVLNFAVTDSNSRKLFRGFLPWHSTACVDLYRNMVVEHFLDKTDFEWLWFIDSDIEIQPDTLYKLLDVADSTNHPVVTGLYTLLLTEGERPSLFYRGIDQTHNKLSMLPYEFNELTYPTMTVDGCGAGCLLLHRSILTTMRTIYPPEKPWFDMGIFDGVPYGEDFTFCMRVSQMGFSILSNTTATVSHNKMVKLTVPSSVRVS